MLTYYALLAQDTVTSKARNTTYARNRRRGRYEAAPTETPVDDTALHGRVLFVPQDDERENANALADAVAGSSVKLGKRGGRLVLVHEGQLFGVTLNTMRKLVENFVVVRQLINRGSAAEPYWDLVYTPYNPTDKEVRALLSDLEHSLTPQRMRGSSLLVRISKV
jgi:hypothetical protein